MLWAGDEGREESRPAAKDPPKGEVRRERGDADVKREGVRDGEGRREGPRDGEAPRERRGEEEKAMMGLPREMAQMIESLKLTDEQRKAVREKLAAKEAVLIEWRRANEPKLKAAMQAMEALQGEQRKLAQAADANIMSVFTREQLANWDVQTVARVFERRGERPLILEEAQQARIKILSEVAVKEILALPTTQPADAEAAKREILDKLHKTIYEEVLDEGQRLAVPKFRTGEGERGRDGLKVRMKEGREEGVRRPEGGPDARPQPKEGGEDR